MNPTNLLSMHTLVKNIRGFKGSLMIKPEFLISGFFVSYGIFEALSVYLILGKWENLQLTAKKPKIKESGLTVRDPCQLFSFYYTTKYHLG